MDTQLGFSFPTVSANFYVATLPILILVLGSLVTLLQSVFKSVGGPRTILSVLLATIIASFTSLFLPVASSGQAFLDGTVLTGDLAVFGQGFILAIAFFVVLLMRETLVGPNFLRGEPVSIFMLVIAGLLMLVTTDDIVTLFVGLEMASIGLYALVGYVRPSRQSQEGAIKYFILGSAAAAILLFGFALLYAGTGSLKLSGMVAAFGKVAEHHWIQMGALLILVGLAFKMALVPFHMWAPDAYESAPTGLTAFMATTMKAAIIIATLRLFGEGFVSIYSVWLPALTVVAVLSMIAGNVMALVQASMKRMLAYSSVAHSGYMAIAICSLAGTSGALPISAVLFYLVGYGVVTIGAFAILMWLESEGRENLVLDDMTGLAKRHPWAAFAMAVFMFSLGGMPPTVGFIGKFFVFNAAVTNHMYMLVVVAAIGSTISLFYYMRVIVRMYMSESKSIFENVVPKASWVTTGIASLAVIVTILLGTILPNTVMMSMKQTSTEVAKR